MNSLSQEQQDILIHVKDGNNVLVDAVAGTGKTTTILSIAKTLNRRKFMQMTYNSALRCEVKEKINQLKLKNIDVHTFHSLAVKYYNPTAYTDTVIRKILFTGSPPIISIERFNVLVLDEAQDMTFLYYQFMSKFINDMGFPIQLLILGDYMQGIYEFKGADKRFLTFADKIWENHPILKTRQFVKCTMKMSYRITNQMCSFVNQALLGEPRMEACRDGIQVLYASNSRSNIERIVFGEITKLLERGVKPSDIFVLAGSVKGANSNIRQLENFLSEKNIPCHVPMLENDKIDERVIDGKVVFSTFHSVKGRQRRHVFVVGFDNSYLRFHARTLPRDVCPNTLYVACTRAIDGLYLLESNQYMTDRPLEFMKMSHMEMNDCDFVNFRGIPRNTFFDISEEQKLKDASLIKKHVTTPTDLIKFIAESVIEEISPIIDRIFSTISPESNTIDIPSIIETKRGFFEEVSDLNGIAIPCMYYDHLQTLWSDSDDSGSQTNILFSIIENYISVMKPNEHTYLKEVVSNLPSQLDTIRDYLYVANVSVAVQETLYFKLKQIEIDEYNWLSENVVNDCKVRLNDVIGIECKTVKPRIEETIIRAVNDDDHNAIDAFLELHFDSSIKFRFTARVDLITENTLWELKCTSKLSLDHLLQTVIYAWLWMMRHPDDPKLFKVFNIRTGELLQLNATLDELNEIMIVLLKGKYQEPVHKTDDEFIADCLTII